MNSQLLQLGWNDYFQNQLDAIDLRSLIPARIVRENRGQYIVSSGEFEIAAQLTGAFRAQALDSRDFPTVGDWVCIEYSPQHDIQIIHSLLTRKTLMKRQVAGAESRSQLIAANIDTLFLISGLDADLNLNRIQRYLTLAGNSGAQPVIISQQIGCLPRRAKRPASSGNGRSECADPCDLRTCGRQSRVYPPIHTTGPNGRHARFVRCR